MTLFSHSLLLHAVWINDAKNMVGNATIGAMMDNLGDISSTIQVDAATKIEVNNNAPSSVEAVCGAIDAMVDAGTPPDLILDTTYAGKTSEVIKSLSLSLGIPTASLSYGDEDDLGLVSETVDDTLNMTLYVL